MCALLVGFCACWLLSELSLIFDICNGAIDGARVTRIKLSWTSSSLLKYDPYHLIISLCAPDCIYIQSNSRSLRQKEITASNQFIPHRYRFIIDFHISSSFISEEVEKMKKSEAEHCRQDHGDPMYIRLVCALIVLYTKPSSF